MAESRFDAGPVQGSLVNWANLNPALAQAQSGTGAGGGVTQYSGATAPYNANAKLYPSMPQQVSIPAFMPGFQQAIAQQLAAGFGQSQAPDFSAFGQSQTARLREPITQTLRAWGLTSNGQPGGLQTLPGGFNPSSYQQYGTQTGLPSLDSVLGLVPAPVPASTGTPGGTVSPPPLPPADPLTPPASPGQYVAPSTAMGRWAGYNSSPLGFWGGNFR